MNPSQIEIRGARVALELYRKVGGVIEKWADSKLFRQFRCNGDGTEFAHYQVAEQMLIHNISGANQAGDSFWLEVVVELNDAAVPVVTLASSFHEEAQTYLAEMDAEEVIEGVNMIFQWGCGSNQIPQK